MMVHGPEQNPKAYLSDFGLACTVSHYCHPELAIPPQWPPEARQLDPQTGQLATRFTLADDVYCFGLTMTEVSYWSECDETYEYVDDNHWGIPNFVAAFLHSGAAAESPRELAASAAADFPRALQTCHTPSLALGGIDAETARREDDHSIVAQACVGAAAATVVSSEQFYDPFGTTSEADGEESCPSLKRTCEFYDPMAASDGPCTKRSRIAANPHRAHIQQWLCSAKKSPHLLPHPWLPYLVCWCTAEDTSTRPSMRMITCLMKLVVEGAPLSALSGLFLSDASVSAAPDAAADWELLSCIAEAAPSQQAIAWPCRSTGNHCLRAVSRLLTVFCFFSRFACFIVFGVTDHDGDCA